MLLPVALRAQITTFPWYEHFDDGAMPTNFTLIDADADGYNWSYGVSSSSHTYAGSAGCATSASYASRAALTPDNWMILPAVTLPDDHQGYTLSFYVRGQDAAWAAEHYSVYISTTAGAAVTDFPATTAVLSDQVATGNYVYQSIDLSSYTGTIYIAFRHHNCTDQFRLNIDEIRIGALAAAEIYVEGPAVLRTGEEGVFSATANTTNIQWYIGSEMQTGATSTTFTHAFTTAGSYDVIAKAHNDLGDDYDTVTVTVLDCATAQTLPFTADFANGLGCWDTMQNSLYGFNWDVEDDSTISSQSSYPSGYSMMDLGTDAWIFSPVLTMPATGSYEVAWNAMSYYASYGYYGDHYAVYLIQGTEPTLLHEETLTMADSVFGERIAFIPSTVTGNFRIAFRHFNSENGYLLLINNIKVRTQSAIVPTVAIEGPASVENGTEATFVANATNASQYAWTVDGTPANEATNTLTRTFTTDGNHTIIVTASNAYGSANDTLVVNVYTCEAISQFPYEEGFESGVLGCWTAISNNTENEAKMGVFEMSGAYEGDHLFTFSSLDGDEDTTDFNQYLISPELNLSEGTTYHFKFQYVGTSSYGTESFTVLTSSTDKQISSFTNEIGYNDEVEAGAWEEFDAVIPAGTKYIAINYNSIWQYRMAVDDIIIEAGVGINDVENVNLTLSPNPASNTVKVSANGIEGTVNVAIVDLNGRTIMEQNGNAQSFTFDVTNVARGAYFVRLTGENVNAVRKLIVK